MEKYIGVKLISAEPQLRGLSMGLTRPNDAVSKHTFEEEGYKVVYEDGYTSWSPKDVFEKAYRKDALTVIEKTSSKPHEQRVEEEFFELISKIEKLGLFIQENPIFKSLSLEEQERLSNQILAMKYYSSILNERILNFK